MKSHLNYEPRQTQKKLNDGYPLEINQLQYPEVFKKAFTPEQTRLLLRRQADAENPSNLRIFEDDSYASKWSGGFDWSETKEGKNYWETMLTIYYYMKKDYYINNRI